MPAASVARTGVLTDTWGRLNRKRADKACCECGQMFHPRHDSLNCPLSGAEILARVDEETDEVKLFPVCACDLANYELALEQAALRAVEDGPELEWRRE